MHNCQLLCIVFFSIILTFLIILIVLKIVIGTVTGIVVDGFHHKGKEDYEYLQVEPCDCGCQESIWMPAIRHTITTFIFILLTNIVFTYLVAVIGEDNLTNILKTNWLLQPIIAGIVGFIPNCAGSVILTQLYVAGGLSFGALVTGLTTSAGVGTLALIRYNEDKKDTAKVLLTSYLVALVIGYIIVILF